MVTAPPFSSTMPIHMQHFIAMQSVVLGFTNRAYDPMHSCTTRHLISLTRLWAMSQYVLG